MKTHLRRPMETRSFCGATTNIVDYAEDTTCTECLERWEAYRAKVKQDASRVTMGFGRRKRKPT